MYFFANDSINNAALMTMKKGAAAPQFIIDANTQQRINNQWNHVLVSLNNKVLYYVGKDSTGRGSEIWSYDVTTNIAKAVTNFKTNLGYLGGYPASLIAFHNKIFFHAADSVQGIRLWS